MPHPPVRRNIWGRAMKPAFSSTLLPAIKQIAAMDQTDGSTPIFDLFARPDIYERRIEVAPLPPRSKDLPPYPYKRADESVN